MSIEAMKQALEALENKRHEYRAYQAITALRQAIEQAEKQALVSSLYSIEPHGDGYAIYCGRDWQHHGMNIGHLTEVTPAAIKLIETALNQKTGQAEKQEPVAWITDFGSSSGPSVSLKSPSGGFFGVITPLYTVSPRKEWVELTDEEINKLSHHESWLKDVIRAIEAKLKEKNT